MNRSVSLRRGNVLRWCWPALLLLLLAGCASKGTISGKVTYQGKPLAAGTITFVPERGGRGAFTASIRDGEYKVEGVPAGPAKIAVSTPMPSNSVNKFIGKMQPPADLMKKMAPDKPVESPDKPSLPTTASIPRKFHDPETSELTYTVISGPQVHNIDIPAK